MREVSNTINKKIHTMDYDIFHFTLADVEIQDRLLRNIYHAQEEYVEHILNPFRWRVADHLNGFLNPEIYQ